LNKFDISEIYQFAIRLEENGEKFYRQMAQKFENAKLKDLFIYLADQEVKHKKLFELMVSKIEKYAPPEIYPEEYFNYIRALADDIIFNEKKLAEEMSKIKDIIGAIDYAKENESASILYYQGIKNLISDSQHASIDKIIEEERNHFVELSQLKKLIE